jgi:hypothetical protein
MCVFLPQTPVLSTKTKILEESTQLSTKKNSDTLSITGQERRWHHGSCYWLYWIRSQCCPHVHLILYESDCEIIWASVLVAEDRLSWSSQHCHISIFLWHVVQGNYLASFFSFVVPIWCHACWEDLSVVTVGCAASQDWKGCALSFPTAGTCLWHLKMSGYRPGKPSVWGSDLQQAPRCAPPSGSLTFLTLTPIQNHLWPLIPPSQNSPSCFHASWPKQKESSTPLCNDVSFSP